MSIKLVFTKNQLLKYHMNIGSVYTSVNRNNSYYLLGLSYNISIVNLNLVIFKLRRGVNNLFATIVKNNLTFFIINTIEHKLLWNSYKKMYKALHISFFLGSWWNGLLKNFKMYRKYKNKKKSIQYYFYKKRLPGFVVFINYNEYFRIDSASSTFSKEINKTRILSLIFGDTSVNTYKAPDIILQNVKNNINNFFLNKITLFLIKRAIFIKKKKFCFRTLKSLKLFSIDFKFRKIYFTNFFCDINKKNFLKKISKWDDLN